MNSWRKTLPAALDAYARDRRVAAPTHNTAGPRSSDTPALASVNHARPNRVGSTQTCQWLASTAELGRHQRRARVWRAVTDVSLAIHPAEGPAPTPIPQVGADQTNSPTPCAAEVQLPSLRVVPARMPSALSRSPCPSGGVAPQRLSRPWVAQSPAGREATEPDPSATNVGAT